MTFDPVTVLAQVVNFAALLAVLRLTLYRPVLNAMRERREALARERAAAEDARRDAERERADLEAAHAAWREEREARERDLDADLDARREARLEAIEAEAERTRAAHADALAHDLDVAVADVRSQAAAALGEELRTALDDLADADLDARAADVLAERLSALGDDDRTPLREAAEAGDLRVATATALPDAVRDRLREALRTVAGRSVDPPFEVDGDLGFGAVVDAGGVRYGWSAADRADAFEAAFREAARQAHDDVAQQEDAADEGRAEDPPEGADGG